MKTKLFIVALLCLWSTPCFSATYWVDAAGGAANWAACAGADPGPGSRCSIAQANAGADDDDIVYLKAGTYTVATGISPTNSGSNGHRITFSAYNGENVEFVANSQTARCIYLPTQDYVTISGVTCTNFNYQLYLGTYPTAAGNANVADSDYNEIDSCTFSGIYNSYVSDVWRGGTVSGNYNWIHDCKFENYGYFGNNDDQGTPLDLGWDDGTAETCINNVVEGNTFNYGGHHVIGIMGSKNVVRNNTFQHAPWSDVGGTLYGSKVIYAIGNSGNDMSNLIENNWIGYGSDSPEADTPEGECVLMNLEYSIWRYNRFVRCYMNGIYIDDNHTGLTGKGSDNAFYNNVFWYNGYNLGNASTEAKDNWDKAYTHAILVDERDGDAINNLFANNIFYQNRNTMVAGNQNDIIEDYDGDNWSLTDLQIIRGNWYSSDGDPKFTSITGTPDPTNPTQYDFTLQSDSGAINNGTYLTQVNDADGCTAASEDCSAMVVDNPYPFQDGWGNGAGGGAVVYADWICLSSSSTATDLSRCKQISSINYATKTITLTSEMSWSNNDYVWLYKNSSGTIVLVGTLPDIGAHEYGGGSDTTAPTLSSGTPSGTVNCSGVSQSVTLGVTTNESSTCKHDTVDHAYDVTSGVTFTTTGGTSHSGTTTLASNASYIFYATCVDTSGNTNTSGTQIYFNINECTPVVEQGQVISPGVGTIKTVSPSTPGSGVFKIK